jgi:hypothetical protein
MHDTGITSNFRNKLSTVLNSVEEDVPSLSFLQDLSYTNNIIRINPETVMEALEKLRPNKQDDSHLSSNYLRLAAPILADFLSIFFVHFDPCP